MIAVEVIPLNVKPSEVRMHIASIHDDVFQRGDVLHNIEFVVCFLALKNGPYSQNSGYFRVVWLG